MLKPFEFHRTRPRPSHAQPALNEVAQAVLRCLAYRRVFNSPLSLDEMAQYLDLRGVAQAEVAQAAQHLQALGLVAREGSAYWIAEMGHPIARWRALRERADAAMPEAQALGRRLLRMPFVQGVALSGSMSKRALAHNGDYDFFILTQPGRLWLAFAAIWCLRKSLPQPSLLCPNFMLSSHHLELERRDGFTAMELNTLVPVGGMALLRSLHAANAWTAEFLPNAQPLALQGHTVQGDPPRGWAGVVEALLPSPLAWLLDHSVRQVVRWRVARKLPHLNTMTTRNSIALESHVAKLHSSEWKYRILEQYQGHLDRLEQLSGSAISRGMVANRVLVASAYYYRLDPKQWRTATPYAPLGTLMVAGLVRSLGFATQVFDAGLAHNELDFLRRLERERPAFVVVQEDGFNYLTKMCLARMRQAALQMCKLARALGAKVIVSSSDATDFPEPYLQAGATAVVHGESEATLADVLQAWRDHRPWQHLAGLSFLLEGQLKRSAARAPITQLDALPMPAWDLVDLEPYARIWRARHGRFSLNVTTTRGCPYACNWCAKPLYGKRYTPRSPEQVVDEMQLLVQRYGADHFWISDDLFGLKPGWVQRFANLVAERGLKLRYTIQTRADLVLRSAQDLKAMAASGLETAWLGAESGSQRILDAMDKDLTRQEIDEAVRALKQHGVRPALFLQYGYLGETLDDIAMTLDMVKTLQPDQIGISVSYPLPGTVFHERVKAQMGKKTHWLHSDDLDMMFSGTYPPNFYRHLHAYTSRRFQMVRCWGVLRGRIEVLHRFGRPHAVLSLLRAALLLPVSRLAMAWSQRPVKPSAVSETSP